jgi:hypothetical protein
LLRVSERGETWRFLKFKHLDIDFSIIRRPTDALTGSWVIDMAKLNWYYNNLKKLERKKRYITSKPFKIYAGLCDFLDEYMSKEDKLDASKTMHAGQAPSEPLTSNTKRQFSTLALDHG